MSSTEPTHEESATIDLDAIERDLADVEMALSRLDAGTYWVDEITGQPLPDDHDLSKDEPDSIPREAKALMDQMGIEWEDLE